MSHVVLLHPPVQLPDGRWKVRIDGLEDDVTWSKVCATREEAETTWAQARDLMRKAATQDGAS